MMDKSTRQEVTNRMLIAMRQVLTIQQYDALAGHLEKISDYEFEQLLAEMLSSEMGQKPVSPKEYTELVEKARKENHITSENSSMNSLPITYLDEVMNEEFWQDICRSRPSDYIHLKTKDDEALCDLWKCSSSVEPGRVPSDLFFTGNIPLHDCRIVVDERDLPDGVICQYRVVVFTDYRERIKESGDTGALVAAIVMDVGKYTSFYPIIVQEGVDWICLGKCGQHGMPSALIKKYKQMVSMQDVANMVYAYMATWYGIQVALLHPTVQEVFRHPRMERVYDPEAAKKGKHKRITRYVKKHVINADEVKRAACGENREFNRHTLIWYVIGHWRHYASGKKVFIQPYWKGALRHLKVDVDGRKREIVLRKGEE